MKSSDLYKLLAIVLAPLLLLAVVYLYIDNPEVHSGMPQVIMVEDNGLSEYAEPSLKFDFISPKSYHTRYLHSELRVELSREPLSKTSKDYIYVYPYPLLLGGGHFYFYLPLGALKMRSEVRSGDSIIILNDEKVELEHGVRYYGKVRGTHKGFLFNRPAKDVYFSFIIENDVKKSSERIDTKENGPDSPQVPNDVDNPTGSD